MQGFNTPNTTKRETDLDAEVLKYIIADAGFLEWLILNSFPRTHRQTVHMLQ